MTEASRRPSTDWKAAIWAGLIGGMVFLILEMLMVPLFLGGSPWGPPRSIAAIVLGQGVLPNPPPPPTFDLGVVMTAVVLHLIMSILYALVLAFIVHRRGTGTAVLVGAVFGLILYLVNFYVFTSIFPWFAGARTWVNIFAHIVFGVVAAWAYKGLAASSVESREPLAS